MFAQKFFHYKLHHVLTWLSVFFLWSEYYRVVDPPEMTWIFAALCTGFAASSFYLAYYYLTPILIHEGRVFRFAILTLISLIVLASLRSASIYIAFEAVFPGSRYWGFFNSITASGFHVGYAMTIAILVRVFIDRYETQKKLDAVAKNNLDAELSFLKGQVNPHFLFNAHNRIYFLIQEDPGKAADTLLKLSALMKYQLYDCSKDTVMLGTEIDHIRNYIELEKMRVEEVVRVIYNNTIDGRDRVIAPFLFLAIVENAFKHVSQEAGRENEIAISFSQHGDRIQLDVTNTTEHNNFSDGGGLGLKNVTRRLELLYPGKFELKTTRANGRYEATMKIML